jgi:hypothetical protein
MLKSRKIIFLALICALASTLAIKQFRDKIFNNPGPRYVQLLYVNATEGQVCWTNPTPHTMLEIVRGFNFPGINSLELFSVDDHRRYFRIDSQELIDLQDFSNKLKIALSIYERPLPSNNRRDCEKVSIIESYPQRFEAGVVSAIEVVNEPTFSRTLLVACLLTFLYYIIFLLLFERRNARAGK